MSREEGHGRIVVGVDGSPSSIRALEWALDQAELTGASVQAVYAWELPSTWGAKVPVYPGSEIAEETEVAEAKLAQAIGEATTGRKQVEVSQRVARGHPAEVLIEAAKAADLMVMGNRGHGGFTGALLGSVTQHCVHHAVCPVVVVRAAGE
ncbi:universal stress protein [Glycomyces sp. L485]|uniref:universal stress protein n=1 Tax=Glycomyces sp. L485 TaxID=2909235 RepID=UPI001F4B659B|nr:universal stress protein [Glycomyces sp. L485]MCH7232863.1 universal stress protein [Glycomyces sp. L485]